MRSWEELWAQVRAFALRNQAPGLLWLADGHRAVVWDEDRRHPTLAS